MPAFHFELLEAKGAYASVFDSPFIGLDQARDAGPATALRGRPWQEPQDALDDGLDDSAFAAAMGQAVKPGKRKFQVRMMNSTTPYRSVEADSPQRAAEIFSKRRLRDYGNGDPVVLVRIVINSSEVVTKAFYAD